MACRVRSGGVNVSVWVVVGGQFGSEGKGKVSAIITLREDIDLCIRCGGPNSGHSFQNEAGELVLVRQLPTGFVRPQTRLLIPAGGLVDLDVLRAEIDTLGLGPERVGVDRNAMTITASDRAHEQQLGLGARAPRNPTPGWRGRGAAAPPLGASRVPPAPLWPSLGPRPGRGGVGRSPTASAGWARPQREKVGFRR